MHHTPTVPDVIERSYVIFARPPSYRRRVTYAELAARVRRVANVLASCGVTPRASLCWRRTVWSISAVGAAGLSGFIAVTLNWRLSTQNRTDYPTPRRRY
jgi:acyl-CoA synthetase (AMP-forming)/AMP-acid ligase II